MIKVTKDGKQVFEIEDSEESMSAARQKGYRPLLEVTKDGSQVFQIDADDMEGVRAAQEKGYKPVAEFQNTQRVMTDAAKRYEAGAGKAASTVVGASGSASFGFDDEIIGRISSLLPGGSSYENERDAIRLQQKAATQANPGYALTGAIGTALLTPGVAAKAGTSLAKSVGIGAGVGTAQGGLAGYGASEEGSELEDTAKGAALGLGLGAAGGALAKSGQIRNAAADKLNDVADERVVKSLEPILSQQELLDNKGIAKLLGRALLTEKGQDGKTIARWGSSVDDMLPRVEAMLEQKGKRLGEIRDLATAKGGKIDLTELEPEAIKRLMSSDGMGTDSNALAEAFAREIENITKRPVRDMNEAADLLGKLGESGKYNKLSAPVKADAVRDVRKGVKTLFDESLANVDKNLFDEHSQTRQMWGLIKEAEQILDKSTARQAKNATFSLRDQLALASQLGREGQLDDNTVRGIALAMASKLIRERGNSAAAVTAKKLADLLKTTAKDGKIKSLAPAAVSAEKQRNDK